jgi:hypothetical protein
MANDTAVPSAQRDSAATTSAGSGPGESSSAKRPGLTETLKEKLAIPRSATPYFVAAFLAAVAMGWYFFLYVPQKLEYFVGLRFRTLAVASGQIKSKAESLGASLNSAPAAPTAAAGEGQTDKYLRLLVPDIRLERTGAGRSPGLQLEVARRDTDPDVPLRATVLWERVASPAAAATAQEFDDLVLADASGRVVWQREKTTPRLGNLTELLYAEDDKGTLMSPSWAIRTVFPAVDSKKGLPKTATLKPIRVGSTSTLMLVQAVHLESPQITDTNQTTLYAAGFVSRSRLQQQAMRIPLAWLVVLWLPIAVLFLALPFIKLATMQAKERFSLANLVLMVFGAIAAAGLGAVIPFGPRSVSDAGDRVLANLATLVDTHLGNETRAVLALATAVVGLGEAPADLRNCVVESTQEWWGSRKLCDLWTPLAIDRRQTDKDRKMPELDVAIWLNDRGDQVRKWTTKAQLTGKTPHKAFEHFQNLASGTLWSLNGTHTDGADPERVVLQRPTVFTIEPLRAPTTAELGTVFAMPLSALGDSPSVRASTSIPEARFLALNVRPRSVVDAVMPPGYGFAIIAPNGRVLFHSEDGLSLEENFFEEVSNARGVRERMQIERAVTWSGDYHGTPHRIHMQPVNALKGSRWKIITFQELNPGLAGIVDHQSGTFRLTLLGLLPLLAAALAVWWYTKWRGRDVRDLFTGLRPADPGRLWGLVVLMVASGGVFIATWLPAAHQWANVLFLFFLMLPLAAVAVSLYARLPDTHCEDERIPRLVRLELAMLIGLVGAVPAAGFARIVHRVQDAQATERWLEVAHQRTVAHADRAHARANSPGYADETRVALTKHLESSGSADRTALHSYLSASPVSTDIDTAAGCTDAPDRGQELVRGLLDWTLFSSDRRGDPEVRACAGSNQLRVSRKGVSLAAIVWPSGAGAEAAADRAQAAGITLWRSLAALEWERWLVATVILVGAIAAGYWAKRRLTTPNAVGAATFEDVMNLIASSDGNQGIMLVGPPRTRKDQVVRKRVMAKAFPKWKDEPNAIDSIRKKIMAKALPQWKEEPNATEPIYRIKLLDRTIDAEFVKTALEEVSRRVKGRKLLEGGKRLWIHVSNLESQLTTDKNRAAVLELLEKLLDRPDGEPSRVVVVTTSVDPIAHFQEIFTKEREGIYDDDVPEVELSRSSLLLSRFRRCYLPIAARSSRDPWWDYKPERWKRTLVWEAAGYPPLKEVAKVIAKTLPKTHSDDACSKPKPVLRPELARTFRSQALASYDLLWESCTRCEKIVLVQLAQEGFVTTRNCEVVWSLVNKGLIVERPRPTIFNNTFRQYLRRIEHDHIVEQWEREDGDGLWVVAGRLIGSSLIAGGLFYLTTQDFSVDSLLPVVSGTGIFGAPVVRALLARMTLRGAASVVSA